jgi:signal transduction histidine kinase
VQTILVVDDKASVRALVREYLTQEGFRVVTAENGRTALYAARYEKPALILLDIMMPEMGGHEFIRAHRQETNTPIILLTAKLDESDKVLGLELGAAFNRMIEDLAQANEARRQMTADIAHDLRTPLTVLSGYIESLRDGVLDPTRARFDTMYAEAQHLQRLVEDLRTLSLADAGELPLNRHPVPPVDLLERLRATYQHAAGQAGIALEIQAEPNLPELDIDSERMAQVLGNLVSNALRYTPEGGQITLAAQSRNGAVTLLVQDTGQGISPEALPRVFDRFNRGDTARQQQEGESGLGLAIARSIVEAHGGTITANSELGRGTVFVIELPV